MGKIGKISVIRKEFPDNFKTFESSLSSAGFPRFPGTNKLFFPHKERTGKYRTGLDVDAEYLKKYSKDDRTVEIERIKKDKDRLEKALGKEGMLDATSPFWNYAAAPKTLIEKFGMDIRIEPVKVGNSDEIFDFTDAMREIQFNFIKVHPQIASSLEAYKRGDCNPDAQYYVADEESENKATYSRKKQINQAIVKFDGLPPTKKRQVARLMGLPVVFDTTEETVYNLVDNLLKQTEFKEGAYKGLSTINIFNEIVNLKDGTLEVKDLIEQAIRYSIYRVGMNGKITEGAMDIAADKDSLLEYLLDDTHQTDLIALKKKLKEKQNINE